jgi:hypothetical protein
MDFIVAFVVAGLIVIAVIEGIALLCTAYTLREKDKLIAGLSRQSERVFNLIENTTNTEFLSSSRTRRGERRSEAPKVKQKSDDDNDWPSIIGE